MFFGYKGVTSAFSSRGSTKLPLDNEFVGPSIGNTGLTSTGELSHLVFEVYQDSLNRGNALFIERLNSGDLVLNPKAPLRTQQGQFIDRLARADLRDFVEANSIENLIDIETRLVNPNGTNFRRPDVRVPSANLIFDATIAPKNINTPQVIDFINFSNGNNVTIVKPFSEGGSFSIPAQFLRN